MFGHLAGLVLLGLGINKSVYAPNPNVMGDSTVATAPAPQYIKGRPFRLDAAQFATQSPDLRAGKSASGPAAFHPAFDLHAFGTAVLHTDADFTREMEASRAAATEQFTAYQTQFHQELSKIQDATKQALVDKINTNCQTVNQKRTDAMTNMLTRLSSILTNVTNRAASASAAGKDIANVTTAITTAQGAIADAQNAVASQSGTVCTISITSPTAIKTDVGHAISGLQSSLQSVYKTVVTARRLVGDAIRALAAVTGEPL